jgi:DNA-directed RNA polymerase specialized sigma24 family protein
VGAELAEIEALYRADYPRYRNALATITGSYESARDAVQQAFAQAIAQRGAFRAEGSLGAWVWKIALRQALALREEFVDANLDGGFDPDFVEPASDPALAVALRALPPRRRLIVFLRYFADLSYPQIAEVVGVSEGTVAATLSTARAALRAALMEGVTTSGD